MLSCVNINDFVKVPFYVLVDTQEALVVRPLVVRTPDEGALVLRPPWL